MSRRRLIACCVFAAAAVAAVLLVVRPRPGTPPAPSLVLALAPLPASPRPAQADPKIRPEIVEALGFTAAPWERRLDLLRRLPGNLKEVELDALLVAMMQPLPAASSTAVYSTYIHEIASVLEREGGIRERLARGLATLARDVTRDEATRDYAIQHLRQVWHRAGDDAPLRTAIASTFREFTRLDPVLSTGALLSLHLLGSTTEGHRPAVGSTPQDSDQLPDAEFASLLDPIFAGKTTANNLPARLTALRIVGERRLPAYRAAMLTILRDRSDHALVRMAAAHALGKIANPDDLQSLAALDAGDPRVATAVQLALRSHSTR